MTEELKINLFTFLSNIKTYTFIEKIKERKNCKYFVHFGKISKEKGHFIPQQNQV